MTDFKQKMSNRPQGVASAICAALFSSLVSFLLVLAVLVPTSSASAADVPQSFTLDGQLFSDTAATTALQDGSIEFKIQVLDDAKICVLYEETQSISTLASKGYFTVQVGTEVGNTKRTAGDSANTMATVFQNVSAINGKLLSNGSPCTVPPVSAQRRFVRITIAPATMGSVARVLSPDLTIDSVPNAVVAERAETLQGLRSTDVLRVNTAAGSALSQSNLESLFTSTTRFNSLTSVIDGTSTNYMRSNSGSGAQLPVLPGAPTTPPIGAIWFDSSDSRIKFQTSVGPSTLGTGAGSVTSVGFTAPSELTVTGAPITAAGTIAVTWAAQTTGRVFASPDGSTGTPTFRSLVAADVPFAIQNLGGTPSFQSGLNAAKGSATTAGRIWISTDTREIYRDNGTTWDSIGSASGGAPTGAASGDLSGTYPGPTVSRIQGVGVSVTAPLDGQVLKYIGGGTTAWTPTNFNIGDLKTAAGTQQFAGSATCASSQTLTWSSLTDTFVCSNIAGLDGGAITAGTVPAARLPASASAWTVVGGDVYRSSGNVGIGTASPSFPVHISTTNTASTIMKIDSTAPLGNTLAGAAILLTASDSSGLLGVYPSDSSTAHRQDRMVVGTGFNATGLNLEAWNTGQDIRFFSGSTVESMRIDSTGRVGIGTTTPSERLTVSGNIGLPTSNSKITGATGVSLEATGDEFGTVRLNLQNRSGVNGAMFEQAGSVDLVDFVFKGLSNQRNIRYEARGPESFVAAPEFQFGQAGNPNLVVSDSTAAFRRGNVGIGTSSPTSSLYVNNNFATTGASPRITLNEESFDQYRSGEIYFTRNSAADTRQAGRLYFKDAGEIGAIYGASGVEGYIYFSTDAPGAGPAQAERMRIDSSGNVGIGTTTPAAKLQVNGAIVSGVTTFSGVFTCDSSTIDFSTGNFQILSPSNTIAAGSCGVTLTNLVAGGSYTLVVAGNAATNAVTYTFPGTTAKFLPANGATSAGNDTIYTFVYTGSVVYVTWAGGYQ